MARKLNKNLVGGLVLTAVATTAAGGIVVVKTLPGQDPAKYAADAAKYREEGDFIRAMKTLWRAYTKDPAKNPAYAVEAAECAIEAGEIAFARSYLDHAKTRDPRLQSALALELGLEFELAKSYDKPAPGWVGRWNAAYELAKKMLEYEEYAESSLAHRVLGIAGLKLGETDEQFGKQGRKAIERAHRLDPASVEVVEALAEEMWSDARAAREKGDDEEADSLHKKLDELFRAAIAKCKGPEAERSGAELRRVQGWFTIRDGVRLAQAGAMEDAEARIREGLARLESLAGEPGAGVEGYLLLGRYFSGLIGVVLDVDVAKAVKYLETALAKDPKDARTYVLLGDVYEIEGASGREGGRQAAKEKRRRIYARGLEEIERTKHFRKWRDNAARIRFFEELIFMDLADAGTLTDPAAKGEKLAGARNWLERLKGEQGTDTLAVRLATARLRYAEGNLIDAIKEAEAARKLVGEQASLDLERFLAQVYIDAELWGAAQEALQHAIALRPLDGALRMAMGRVLIRLNRPDQALRHLEPDESSPLRALLDDAPQALRLRVRAYRMLGQLDKAAQLSRRIGEGDPADDLREATTILFWEERYDEAEAKLKAILEGEPQNPRAIQGLLSVYEKTDRLDDARALVRSLRKLDPENRRYRQYELILQRDTDQEARDALTLEWIQEEPDPFARYIALASFHSQRAEIRDQRSEGATGPDAASGSASGSPDVRRDHRSKAREYLDKAEALRPDSSNVIEAQLKLALFDRDWAKAEVYARKHGEYNIDGTRGKIAQGRIALARAEAAKPDPALPATPEHEPQSHRDTEEPPAAPADSTKLTLEAIDLFRAGLAEFPSYLRGWSYLADAYMAAGRVDDAKECLERGLQIDPTDGHLNRSRAAVAATLGDEATERKHLELAAREMPNDPWVRRRLSVYRELENPQEGIERRERLRKENPDDLENLVRLARLYATPAIQNLEKAAELYRLAVQKSGRDLAVVREAALFFASPERNEPEEGERLLHDMMKHADTPNQKAVAAANLAQFFENQHHLHTADRWYRTAVSLDPSRDILLVAAEFCARTRRHDDALEYFGRALAATRDQRSEVRDQRSAISAQTDDPEMRRKIRGRMIVLTLDQAEFDRALPMIEQYVKDYPDDPQGMIYEGEYHRLAGDVAKAKEALNRHLERNPESAIALYQRGSLHMLLGAWELAIEDLKRAKTFQPGPGPLGLRHRIALAEALAQAGREAEAITELQSALEADPKNEAAADALFNLYMRRRQFADAEKLIWQKKHEFPNEYKWPMMLGRLGELTLDWPKAVEAYEMAVEVGGYQPDTVRALMLAYRQAGQYQAIIECATKKLATSRIQGASGTVLDRSPEAMAALAWAYSRAGLEDECVAAFDGALAASAGSFAAYTSVVTDMAAVLGREAALERARSQSKASPDDMGKLRVLVEMLRLNEKFDEAIEVCGSIQEKATKDQERVFAHLAKGMLLSLRGDSERAKAEYEAALEYDPDQPFTLNNLAYLLAEEMDNAAEALPYAKRACRLEPGNPDALDTYGWALAKAGKLGEALGRLLQAAERRRDDPIILYHLGVVHTQRGEYEPARTRLLRARSLAVEQDNNDLLPKITEALEAAEAGR